MRIGRGSRLVLATHNPGKLREIADLLAPCGVDVVSAGQLGLPEPEETAPDFVGNARLKALAAAAQGVVSARWAGPEKDFGAAMRRVWDGVGDQVDGGGDRRAWFVCALCLAWPDGRTATYLGRAEGTLAWPPRGTLGFGYDPMFTPAGGTLTYGEMPPDEKHAISHRAAAMAQLLAACFDPIP